jgi:hypothetical protein
MKKHIFGAVVAVLLVAAAARPSQATEVGYSRKFGLGVMVGDPTGLTAKLWVGPTNALDFGFGFYGYGVNDRCFRDGNGNVVCDHFSYHTATFNTDYLWQSNIVRGAAQLDWHVGVGGRLNIYGGDCATDCAALAARAPIGLDLMFNNPGFLEVFFEISPITFYVFPSFEWVIEGGLGVRFYF